MPPEAPQVVLCALFVGGRRHRNHLVLACVQRRGDTPDRAAFAGGVPAFEDENRGKPAAPGFAVEKIEAALGLGERDIVGRLPDRARHVEVGQRPSGRPPCPRGLRALGRALQHFGHSGDPSRPPALLLLVEAPRHPIADRARDDKAAVPLVGSVHQRPRRLARIRQPHRRGLGLDQLVVRPRLAPLLGGDPPAGEGVTFERLEALPLRVALEVDHELQDQRAVVGEQLLEARDSLQLAPELRGGGQPDEHAGRSARRTTR